MYRIEQTIYSRVGDDPMRATVVDPLGVPVPTLVAATDLAEHYHKAATGTGTIAVETRLWQDDGKGEQLVRHWAWGQSFDSCSMPDEHPVGTLRALPARHDWVSFDEAVGGVK